MKKIIIFGATGNVGSYLTKYCLDYFDQSEYEIIVSGRRKTDFFTKRGVKYYSVDVTEEEDFKKLPTEDVYAVLLLSAQIPSYMNGYKPKEYIDSNIIGAFNVLEYCRKVNADRIIYTQTVFDISLYANEDTTLRPDLPKNFSYKGDHAVYVISKNTALELIEHYRQEYDIKSFIFRLPTIYSYSPYQYYHPNGIKKLRPVYQMINKAQNSEPIELWGNPNYAKDMVHVYDFSQMICKAIEVNREHGFYNVGTGIPVTLKEQIETIIKVFSPSENPSQIIYCSEKPSTGGFLMDITNAKEELGYEPQYDCLRLFEDYKFEMTVNRFKELREE
ncbi:NAD-dependent epimerase/dehydratase family protein [Clostridium weizhouense]|uniref:NAD(P)-dependent oxidoreductase n=1 Tax=Clostridium weizhouense TaxID=2859781 RepID=A0ABS7ANQ1_9CLOT|nr:NAD(P)-dependent oxidoreductase [Clostridium weizhouense]MBW6410297.1 NAD(P)-dependent oxidoreductase [Clostridium weizhouense]